MTVKTDSLHPKFVLVSLALMATMRCWLMMIR